MATRVMSDLNGGSKLVRNRVLDSYKPRNPERIDVLLGLLGDVWKDQPDLRLGQLIISLTPVGRDPFYLEDDELETILIEQRDISSRKQDSRLERCTEYSGLNAPAEDEIPEALLIKLKDSAVKERWNQLSYRIQCGCALVYDRSEPLVSMAWAVEAAVEAWEKQCRKGKPDIDFESFKEVYIANYIEGGKQTFCTFQWNVFCKLVAMFIKDGWGIPDITLFTNHSEQEIKEALIREGIPYEEQTSAKTGENP